MNVREQRLLQSVQYYRQLHFFKQYNDLSDTELVDRLEAVKEAEGDIIRSSSAEEYLHLDENRILSVDRDAYCDDEVFCQDDNINVETLQKWARISQ